MQKFEQEQRYIQELNLKILIINGPNLNLLGNREKSLYGNLSLEQIQKITEEKLKGQNIELDWFQSNFESEIIEKIQEFHGSPNHNALIINPGAFSHTSLAIRDALKVVGKPIAEVHLTNIYAREKKRHSLLTAEAADFIMEGLGEKAYYAAAWYILTELSS